MRIRIILPLVTTFTLLLALAPPTCAQDFTWTGWFGPPGSNPAWGHDWASEGNTYSNGWGRTWPHYEDPVPHYPGPSSAVLIPAGVVLDIEGGVAARCGDLTLEPGSQLLFPQASLAIHGPTCLNNGHISAWGITTMGGCFELYDSLELIGTGDVQLDAARIYSWQTGAVLTVGPQQMIHGSGEIGWEPNGNYHGISLTNQGVIRATEPAVPLTIHGTNVHNLGSVEAVGQSELRLFGAWDNSGGEILAQDDAVIILYNHPTDRAIIDGGTLRTAGNGVIRSTGGAGVENITLEGTLSIPRYEDLHMADTIVNNGTVHQGFYSGVGFASLYVDSALTFLGDGQLLLGFGNIIEMHNNPDHNASLTNGPDHTIISEGGTFGQLPNYYGDQRLNLVNEGTLICRDAPYSNEFQMADEGFVNRGTLTIEPSASQYCRLWGGFTQTGGRLECDDLFRLETAEDSFVFSGGVLAGNGHLEGRTVIGAATIHPGDQNEIGTLEITGDLTLNDGATLVCEWSFDQKDRLVVHGQVTATGAVALKIEYLGLGQPAKGEDFSLIICDEIDDQATWSLDLPAGWTYDGLVWEDGVLVVQGMSGMPSTAPDLPAAVALRGASPNPFNPKTTVSFNLDREGPVQLWICDVAGRRLRSLVDGLRSAGEHHVEWDGCDGAGRALGSGTYLCVLEISGQRWTRAMALVR